MTAELAPELLTALQERVCEAYGLDFPQRRWGDLARGVAQVATELGYEAPAPLAQALLESGVSQPVWKALAAHLTVGETYFLRERETLEIFSEQILPELIRARRATRTLRLWSAACCTGEEAYTIAILLRQALPDWAQWQITLLATDLNPQYLSKAEAGVYGAWSFRGTPAWLKERHFCTLPNGRFEIDPQIRRMVRFETLNLASESYAGAEGGPQAMDVIFCRNVLMYFTPEQAAAALRRLHAAQAEGGWLIVSPSETPHLRFPLYNTVSFPHAVLYRKLRRPPAGQESAIASDAPAASAFAGRSLADDPTWRVPSSSVPLGQPLEAVQMPNPPVAPMEPVPSAEFEAPAPAASESFGAAGPAAPTPVSAFERQARALADAGQGDAALACCQAWIAADKLDPHAYHLLGLVLQELGRPEEAAEALAKALYLNPHFASAHFALGNLARLRGEAGRARRHFDNARAALAHPQPGVPEEASADPPATPGQVPEAPMAADPDIHGHHDATRELNAALQIMQPKGDAR